MRRSALVVLVTVLVGLFLPALPAAAVTSANVTEPTSGQTITEESPVPVKVLVDRLSSDPAVNSVRVRLFGDGSSYSLTALGCRDGCGSSQQTWASEFDPRPAPIRNGGWNLQVQVNDGSFENKFTIYLSLPPSPVSDLKATTQEGSVKLTWTQAPEPDISGYRVERSNDGQWQEVKRLGPDSSSYTDSVPAGTYTYRVISVRPSGKSDRPALTAASRSKSTSVAPAPETTPHKDAPTQPDSAKDKAGGGTGSGPGTAAGANGGGSAPAADAPGGSGRAGRGPLAGDVPPPPPARRGFSFNLRSVARVFGFESPDEAQEGEEGYFGEGEGFSDELDYNGVDPVTGEPIAVPLRDGGLQGMLMSQLSNRPLLVSLTIGLLLVLLAVFILRWSRRSPVTTADPGSPEAGSMAPPTGLRRLLRGRGQAGTSKRIPSPTATPLSPRATQTRPVRAQDAAASTNGRPPAASVRGQRHSGQTATAPIFGREGERRPAPGGDARSGASELFPQSRSATTPPSARGPRGSDTGTETVKILRPEPSSRGTGRKVP